MQAHKQIAFITGITGQDGSYLAEFLLEKEYEVHGLIRRTSMMSSRLDNLLQEERHNANLNLHYGDVTDAACMTALIGAIKPTEVYHLAAQSHVAVSFDVPQYTANVDAIGTLNILTAIKSCGLTRITRFYQASTSELYGKVVEVPQNEDTPFYPRSPYGVAKLYAYWMTVNYRESYEMHASNGILFNHESPRRGENFVTRKITRSLAKISRGSKERLTLGNLDARRDWGYAKDYVELMWLMLQQDTPDDYVAATGQQHSVRDFVNEAAKYLNMKLVWEGEGVSEKAYDASGNCIVEVSEQFYRPAEVETLLGDSRKAKIKLGWMPKTSFQDLVRIMVEHDLSTTTP